jgi:hypothetical protein
VPPQFHLTPTFMGLLGAHGALPGHVTERIAAWEASQPDAQLAGAPRAFLDIFTTRMLALFYGAWRKYRVEHSVVADGSDGFLPLLLALAGFAPAPHEAVDDATLARYAGVLRQRPASAVVLARVLSHHFGVPVALQEGIGFWDALAAGEQSSWAALRGTGALSQRYSARPPCWASAAGARTCACACASGRCAAPSSSASCRTRTGPAPCARCSACSPRRPSATRWCWCWRAANCGPRAWPAARSAWAATAS